MINVNTFFRIKLLSLMLAVATSANATGSDSSIKAQEKDSLASTKIVGGQEAVAENWPWMTALVSTIQEISTSLTVGSISYQSDSFNYSPLGSVSGDLMSCGSAPNNDDGSTNPCADATSKVCLIQRGTNTFAEKLTNCEAGGGIGAIIYNNVAGIISGTLGEDFSGSIPVVAVTQQDGISILEQIGQVASLSVTSSSALAQDASCGATFLGDKWVMTAAHCVDAPNALTFKMNVGEYDLSDGAENAIDIAQIYIHPMYDEEAISSDIALVELVSSVLTPGVTVADTQTTELYINELSAVTVAGWGGRVGYESGGGPTSDFPDILHQVDLQLMSNQDCRNLLGSGVTDVMLCAGILEGGKGSCQGDSGGPLVVNTGTGPEQIGIVSWGIGCAAPNLPGVYTRVSAFKDWMAKIMDGIAITQRVDYPMSPVGFLQTRTLHVSNNSTTSVSLNFSLSDSSNFALDSSDCATLAPSASCELVSSFMPNSGGTKEAQIMITTDSSSVATSMATLSGKAAPAAANLDGIAGTTNPKVSWYSGGDATWLANSIAGVESGAIGGYQESILIAQIEGEGTLDFEWSVSSEENTDDPSDPYDTLNFYISGELQNLISGEVPFTSYGTVSLEAGDNILAWVYVKDQSTEAGDDKGYVRNVSFTSTAAVEPTPTPTPTPTPSPTPDSSGGGTVSWIIALLAVMGIRRRLAK